MCRENKFHASAFLFTLLVTYEFIFGQENKYKLTTTKLSEGKNRFKLTKRKEKAIVKRKQSEKSFSWYEYIDYYIISLISGKNFHRNVELGI